MKKLLLALVALSLTMASIAQTDSTDKEKADTIRIGGMIIIKKPGKDGKEDKEIVISNRKRNYNSNVSTNWMILDLGFSNFNDNTNYSSAEAQDFARGFTKDNMKLHNSKSVNVNIWFFMQRLNLVKHVVNLKYGLGLELNNYHFDDKRIRFHEDPTFITLDSAYGHLKKNKLAADYITIPMMLNFNLTPNRRKAFGFSAGISAGYLYSSRQKIKGLDDKSKLKDDFNLRDWKISYVGELNLGPVKLYGSYATKSMWEKGLNQKPYNVGIRLSY
jgi:Outer membrane protein beta-barrel domain